MRWCWAACAMPASCRAWLRSACASFCRCTVAALHSWVLWAFTLNLHPEFTKKCKDDEGHVLPEAL